MRLRWALEDIAWCSTITLLAGGFLCYLFGAGCAIPLEVDVDVGIAFDDPCLLLFPECGTVPGVPYRCVDSGGTPDYDCIVACFAARELTCEPDGPVCTQRLGDEEHWVPVVCVERNPS